MTARARPQRIRLSAALAQRIVDELAPAIQENLNLMDAEGFIIASSDVSRVGTLHPGAREAAATNQVVDVHSGTAREGERPGVNLPLEYRGRVIGVVGVTGKPAKVRSLAPVLVLTIALLFERESELAGESRRDAADRDVLARLVFGSRPRDAIALLSKRTPALAGPWVLAAGIAASADAGALDDRALTRLRGRLGPGAVVGALRGVLWVLVSAADRPASAASRRLGARETGAEVAERIAELLPTVRLAYGGLCMDDDELLREASHLATLSTRPWLWPEGGAGLVSGRYVGLAAAQLPPAMSASLRGVLAGVTAGERETLAGYLRSGVAAELSRTGYTHRNTVRRRLDSIAERTGFDVRVPEQAAVLALALAAEEEWVHGGQ